MKELKIGRNDAGQRVDRFLAKAVPLLPASLAQKYLRLKRIKRNNARVNRDDRLAEGDVLQLYINDEFFDTPREDNAYLTVSAPKRAVTVAALPTVILVELVCFTFAFGPLPARTRPPPAISRSAFM